MPTDIEIARAAQMAPISEIAAKLDIPGEGLISYGPHKAKLSQSFSAGLSPRPDARLVLVTAISPTPAGEGKTTTTVGLGDALVRIGERVAICLREPSLGPCFGLKGGAAGGGYAQVVPMEDINLHFTGDFHAISAANNLLAAMIDNHVYWGNELEIDTRRIGWRRVVDMNDRALRDTVLSLGGPANGFARQSGFDITVASEVMAILCLSRDLADLEQRLGDIVIGTRRDNSVIHARELKADGAMAVLLKDAMLPNLVQTLEGTPAFVHGGPFANIAHGCNSVAATRAAMGLADIVVTEAGFGADLGAEKFFNIKCRQAGLSPAASVVVATVRALKHHGCVAREDLDRNDTEAVKRGLPNLARHIENVQRFGVPVTVAINRFGSDSEEELEVVHQFCANRHVAAHVCTHFADGGAGAEDLARGVAQLARSGKARFRTLYPDELPLWDKIRTVASDIYGAADISTTKGVRAQIERLQNGGFGDLPVCMAKTQYSFSTDPTALGAPGGHIVPVREVRLSAGARFIVVICGEIMTMPGLPRRPAAEHIRLNEQGWIEGLS